jgi:hypothetical protein
MPTLGRTRIVIDKETVPCRYDDVFGRSESPVCPYCYVFLKEGVEAKSVIGRLKIVAKEVACTRLL